MTPVGLSKFVTETEVEEAKRRRQAEWERVRRPEDPVEAPEPDSADLRPLYQRLEEQRHRREAEREESRQLKNLVRGLDSDEVTFLDSVDDLRAQQEKAQREEEKRELEEFRVRTQLAKLLPHTGTEEVFFESIEIGKSMKNSTASEESSADRSNTKSQAKLLAGAIKRKLPQARGVPNVCGSQQCDVNSDTVVITAQSQPTPIEQQPVAILAAKLPRVLGVLPGLGNYADSDSSEADSDNSSVDEEPLESTNENVGRRVPNQ